MNNEQRKQLMKQVMDMHILGSTYDEIAETLQIGRKTVNRYLRHLREKAYEDMKNTAEHEIAQMEINKAKRLKQLWQIVLDKNTKPRDKSRALNLIRNEEEFTVKRRQIIGLMPADKQEIEHVGTPLQEGITINIIKPENGPDNMETDSKTVPSSGNPERQNND